ncbi:MAG TPA: hypothetical protein VN328_01775 [Thermodesulfovibrionales bacterium]|nr:hypothetical protein [Thermodesulfovibrionales bacterium]
MKPDDKKSLFNLVLILAVKMLLSISAAVRFLLTRVQALSDEGKSFNWSFLDYYNE